MPPAKTYWVPAGMLRLVRWSWLPGALGSSNTAVQVFSPPGVMAAGVEVTGAPRSAAARSRAARASGLLKKPVRSRL